MKIKALSLTQPWASRIAGGEKTIETRTWPTRHRGPLLICATRGPKELCRGCALRFLAHEEAPTVQMPARCFRDCGAPYGCAVAVARLVDVRPMRREDEPAACCELYARAQAWVLEEVWPIPAAARFPVTGFPSLWDEDLAGRGVVELVAENMARRIVI